MYIYVYIYKHINIIITYMYMYFVCLFDLACFFLSSFSSLI